MNKGMTNLNLLTFLILYMSGVLYAEEKVDQLLSYTKEELRGLALKHNSQVRSMYVEWKSVVAEIAVAKSLPDPKISFTEFIEEIQTRVGPQRRKIAFSQMFPWFGTLKERKDLMAAKADLVEQKLENLRLIILHQLEITLCDIHLVDRKLVINSEHLELLLDIEMSQRGQLKSGKGYLANVLRVQVEKEKLKNLITTLKAFKKPLFRKLEKVLGVKLKKKIPTYVIPKNIVLDKKVLKERYLKHSPLWMSNQYDKSMQQHKMKLAKKSGKPNIGLGLSWVDTGPANNTNMMGSGKDPLALTVLLSLPLWRSKVNAKVKSAEYSYDAMVLKDKGLMEEFESNVELVLFRIQDALRKKKLYSEELLPKAKDAYLSSRKAHETGRISFQNMLDAERLFLRFSLDYEVALIEQAKAVADLEKMIGIRLY